MIAIYPIITCLRIFFHSCNTRKEDKLLKQTTESWIHAPTVLHAYADTPFYGIFLTLRDNRKFEHIVSSPLGSFQAGKRSNNQDTIWLIYTNSKLNVLQKQIVVIDRKTSTLVFEGDSTPVPARLRIITNKL
jgi:hypothetical protein